MLHHMRCIAVFYSLGNQTALDISSIYKIIFKITVGTTDSRFAKDTINGNISAFLIDRYQFLCNFFAINTIHQFLNISIARSMKFHLSILDKLERHIRF